MWYHLNVNTNYDMHRIGSPLLFHLNPVGFSSNIITNIPELSMFPFTTHELPKLLLSFISEERDVVPKNWVLTEDERVFLATIQVTEENPCVLEQETVRQSLRELWKRSRKTWITSSNSHIIFIEKRNFQALAESFLNPNLESDLPAATRIYEPVACEKYVHVMKFHLNRNIDVRETALVLQPNLFWLAASPDGLVSDKQNEDVRQIGLIEIIFPKSKTDSKINDLVHDQSLYVKYEDGVPVLKKYPPNGYYTQMQMAMGLSQKTFCDFSVHTFDGMIIIWTQFDKGFFFLLQKLSSFYKGFMLPKLVTNLKNCTS